MSHRSMWLGPPNRKRKTHALRRRFWSAGAAAARPEAGQVREAEAEGGQPGSEEGTAARHPHVLRRADGRAGRDNRRRLTFPNPGRSVKQHPPMYPTHLTTIPMRHTNRHASHGARHACATVAACFVLCWAVAQTPAAEPRLVGHWKLAGDAADSSGNGLHAKPHGVEFRSKGPDGQLPAATFDGKGRSPDRRPGGGLHLGTGDFTLALWVHCDERLDDRPGGPRHPVRPEEAGRVQPVAPDQHGRDEQPAEHPAAPVRDRRRHRADVGRRGPAGQRGPGLRPGRPRRAPVRRDVRQRQGGRRAGVPVRGAGQWTDCGAPDRCNAVSAMAVHRGEALRRDGQVSVRRLRPPRVGEPEPGRRGLPVRRRDDAGPRSAGCPTRRRSAGWWSSRAGCTPRRCTSRPGSSGTRPTAAGRRCRSRTASGWSRSAVYNGFLWAPATTAAACTGSTAPRGRTSASSATTPRPTRSPPTVAGCASAPGRAEGLPPGGGRHAGRTSAGSATSWRSWACSSTTASCTRGRSRSAEVYRYDGGRTWTRTARLDRTPDVKYRRAWTMAQYRGRLFCTTLPSGRVHSLTAGACVTHDRELPAGWRHVAAVRQGGVAPAVRGRQGGGRVGPVRPRPVRPDTGEPLVIGAGAGDFFRGVAA